MKVEVAEDLRMIFNAPNRANVEAYLARVIVKYAKIAPKLADWMEINIPEGLTVFAFPISHQRKLRTTNGIERLNRELHRRTDEVIFSIFSLLTCKKLLCHFPEDYLYYQHYRKFIFRKHCV